AVGRRRADGGAAPGAHGRGRPGTTRGGRARRAGRGRLVASPGGFPEDPAVSSRGRLLVLWNQTEEDIYEKYREEGPRPLPFDPTREASDVGTVAEEMAAFVAGLEESRFAV